MPHHHVAVLGGAGHHPHLQHPGAVGRLLAEHVAQAAPMRLSAATWRTPAAALPCGG